MCAEKIVVISQPWGGLGDNLQYSTLPELYSKLGYKVYISDKNVYRNPEINDLVWKLNPYVEGISDAEATAGACRGYEASTPYFTKNTELAHGLTNGYRVYPVIYYKPKLVQELSNCLLYDVTSISRNPNDNLVKGSFEHIFSKYPGLSIKKIEFTSIHNRDTSYFAHDVYTIRSIYDLCDAIYSCKVFVCLFSGASVLASALKRSRTSPEIYSFHESEYNNTSSFKYKNINYLELTSS